jgi:hypothetical protein
MSLHSPLPQKSDILNVNNLNYKQNYPDFDYNNYINEITLSNFVPQNGGKNSKKNNNIMKILKQSYMHYMNGGSSKLKYYAQGGDQAFPIPLRDIHNTANLTYNTCFNPAKPRHMSVVPYSSFGLS